MPPSLGLELDMEEVDLMAGENRQAAFLARNPSGQCPALELDDGTVIAEITAICEYLDDITPGKTLIGNTAQERAVAHMWTRRVDLGICEPMANGFRYAEGIKIFESRMITLPEAADGLKRIAADKLTWLDAQMSDRSGIHCRCLVDHGGYYTVRHGGLFRWGRPTTGFNQHQCTSLV
jgi:glutathione S-transferase